MKKVTKLLVHTALNYRSSEPRKLSLQMLTRPDMTLTISQILERHTRGLGFSDIREATYTGETDFLDGKDYRTLDIEERHQLISDQRTHVRQLQKNIEELRSAKLRENIQPATMAEATTASKASDEEVQRASGAQRKPE